MHVIDDVNVNDDMIMNDMNVNNDSYIILVFDKQGKCHNLFSFKLRTILPRIQEHEIKIIELYEIASSNMHH